MINYPQTLKDLQAELHKYSTVGRADRPFRFAIAISQLGNIAMHLTHDPKENPYENKRSKTKQGIRKTSESFLCNAQ